METEPIETDVQRDKASPKLAQLVYMLTGLVELALVVRLLLTFFGANASNAFASFIYSFTAPLVAPFYGLFNTTFQIGVAHLETETLVAIVVVGIIGRAIGALIDLILK